MSKYIGDFKKGQVIRVKFNTFSQGIVPTTPTISPTVAIYKDSATEFTTGVTQPTVDYDGKAGLHELVIDTSDVVYVPGDYDIVFTAGTVDGKDLTRTILRTFSLENRNTDANVIRIAGQTANAATAVTFPALVANETTAASRATQTSVNAIPTTPLLATDVRLDNLNATISSRMPSGSVTVGTNNDKTGYSLSSGGILDIFAVLTSTLTTVGSVGKLIADNLNAAVGSIPTANQNRDAVMNAMPNGGWVSGSFGDRWVIGVNNNREVQVTGSNHISADVHAMQNNTITNNALDASAITKIQSGLSTLTSAGIRDAIGLASNNLDTQLSLLPNIKTVTDKINTALELDGLVYRFTANALELGPAGGVGSSDWTSDERIAIRTILGIPSSGITPIDPSSGILDVIRDLVVTVDNIVDAIEVDTQNIQSRIPTSLIAGRMAANAEIVSDKTGYSITQAFPSNFSSMNIDINGKVLLQPAQTGVTIPTVTTVTNGVSVSTNNDKTGYSLVTAYDAAKTAASQSSVNSIPLNPLLTNDARLNSLSNLDAAVSTRLASTSYVSPDNTSISTIKTITDQITFTGGRVNSVLNQSFPSNFASMSIDASGKVLLQPSQTGVTIPTVASITNGVTVSTIGTNVITSDVLAVSAVNKMQNGLALETTSQSTLSSVNTLTSRITAGVANMFQDLIAMIQGTGTGLVKWTASALSLAPAGGGGGGGNVTVNANILPIQSYMRKRIESETISLFYNESTDIFITLEDENGPIDVTGKTLEFVIETKNKTNLVVISNGNIAKSSTGVSVRISTEVTANVGTYLWALRDLTGGDTVLSHGFAEVSYAPKS